MIAVLLVCEFIAEFGKEENIYRLFAEANNVIIRILLIPGIYDCFCREYQKTSEGVKNEKLLKYNYGDLYDHKELE